MWHLDFYRTDLPKLFRSSRKTLPSPFSSLPFPAMWLLTAAGWPHHESRKVCLETGSDAWQCLSLAVFFFAERHQSPFVVLRTSAEKSRWNPITLSSYATRHLLTYNWTIFPKRITFKVDQNIPQYLSPDLNRRAFVLFSALCTRKKINGFYDMWQFEPFLKKSWLRPFLPGVELLSLCRLLWIRVMQMSNECSSREWEKPNDDKNVDGG